VSNPLKIQKTREELIKALRVGLGLLFSGSIILFYQPPWNTPLHQPNLEQNLPYGSVAQRNGFAFPALFLSIVAWGMVFFKFDILEVVLEI
jgi:hypothetical protein